MTQTSINKIIQKKPLVELYINNGSERCTYIPEEDLISKLGKPHFGVNLMSEYYLPFNKERRLFGPDVPHFRRSKYDETANTKLLSKEDSTDGYYPFDINDPKNEVILQMEDVRKYGQKIRLTMTADTDTKTEDLEKIAYFMKDFGPLDFRLNHEANGNGGWFRFAKRVGTDEVSNEDKKKIYSDISNLFIRTNKIMAEIAPNVTMVACYCGPSEKINRVDIDSMDFPCLNDDELGLMYKLEGIKISLDQYGSLHYGWPGHKIINAPLLGKVTHDEHKSFSLPPERLHNYMKKFRDFMSNLRGEEELVLDLGEMNYEQDIHGPKRTAELISQSYDWFKRNPKIIGSVVFYSATDTGGLGAFKQNNYVNIKDLEENEVTDAYRRIIQHNSFQNQTKIINKIHGGTSNADLRWQSPSDAEGLELILEKASIIDFKEEYWKEIIYTNYEDKKTYKFTNDRKVLSFPDTKKLTVFALPSDGRNNCKDGYRINVPVPKVI